ncbi:MAG: hypothetical protein KKH92_02155 [Firmicutes bacterium]|nr:hypothetical protein [Bacillota bacterium]
MKPSKLSISFQISIRITFMLVLQWITYLILIGSDHAFEQSGFYWATQLTVVNISLLIWMIYQFKKQGSNYLHLYKGVNKKNTFYFLKIFIPILIISMLPNILLSLLFYQDPEIGTTFLIGDIPNMFMLFNLMIFPLFQGLVEIPFYFFYILPKLKSLTYNKYIYIGLPVLFLSIQHAFMPFRFDLIYLIYRSLVFLPFAVFIGLLLDRKKEMLPYLVIIHILMNTSLFVMYFIH